MAMPSQLPLHNSALADSANVVNRRQQRLWTLPGQPSSELAYMLETVAAKQRPSSNSGYVVRAASAPVSYRSEGISPKERQELLWQDFFLDTAQWWDNRPDKKTARHPDFTHKASKAALWLNNPNKPSWVDLELARWDARVRGPPGFASTSASKTDVSSSRAATGAGDSVVEALRRQCGEGELPEAVEALNLLLQRGCNVNETLFYRVLKRCRSQKDLGLGKRVHALAMESGHESNAFLATHIIGMYASHGRLEDAKQVFTKVAAPNAYMWASIILAHARHGESAQAVKLYRQMRESGVKADNHVYVAVLKACAVGEDLASGKEVHTDIRGSAEEPNIYVGNCLLDMYAKCGSLEDARKVFDRLPTRDVVSWNSMIAGYSKHGLGQEALSLYATMQKDGLTPADVVTFVCLLQACARVRDLQQGRELHAQIEERRLEADVIVGNCLVDMYSKCASMEDAHRVFDRLRTRDVVTWTAMIGAYAQHGEPTKAIRLYRKMRESSVKPDNHIFVAVLRACATAADLASGREVHADIVQSETEANLYVGNCLVDMYAKCGSLEDARRVFDRLPRRDTVTWNAMISGYAQHEQGDEAFSLYASMQEAGATPADNVTFVCLLQACASVGALHHGRQLHAQIKEVGLEADRVVGSCLVAMYAKCGSLVDARRVLDSVPFRDVVIWTALLNGYAENSNSQMAIQCFEEMRQDGVKPNETTFICLLVACSHAGLVQDGKRYFHMMVEEYGIAPTASHYNCMVDLLGRSGHLDEAEEMLLTMPVESDLVGWTSLLSACKSHGDVERAKRCFNRLIKFEPDSGTPYVLLANVYANAGRWREVERIENLRKSAGAKKKPAKACIEVQSKVHEFTVGEDRSDISSKVRNVNSKLRVEGGHVPHTELVLKSAPEEAKEESLCGHAEKLALAYGLLNTPDGTTLLVTKNLRMCNDCHSSTKIMSTVEKREIVVRDAHRVHRFMDGACSCGDRH